MAPNLLPIRILFHATFAFVYLPIIGLGFTWGLSLGAAEDDTDVPFVPNHFDGITALSALVGLGIFAALDILTIRRTVNQRAFLIIEIIVVVLMPLSMWPFIMSSISVVWSKRFAALFETICDTSVVSDGPLPWICIWMLSAADFQASGDEITFAYVVAAAVAILALNAAFLSYICIAAVTDKARGSNFMPIYLGNPSLSAPEVLRNWYLLGNQRTIAERKAMTSHCADYIFRNSVFRKHAFEPTIWAIFHGIIAIYACVSLVVFSAYSALSEAQLRRTLTVGETITMVAPYELLWMSFGLSVASFLMVPPPGTSTVTVNLSPEQNPPPTLSFNTTSGHVWQNPSPGFWANDDIDNFNISWTGEYSLLTWVTSNGCSPASQFPGTGSFNSTQVNSTNPLILAPFKQYTIVLIGIKYTLPDCTFTQWIPDFFTSVDSGSGPNASMVTFSFNGYQQQVLTRDFSPPSIFSSVAHVLSQIGGTLSFIDGLFALIFGRTIMAIIFEYAERAPGTRVVSPFGLLGMVTHGRFKRLIHEQYPRMQEDIEHGGMAAYISEVAIDAALMDVPLAKGSTSPSPIENLADGGDAMELRRRQTGSSGTDLESNPLLGREAGHE